MAMVKKSITVTDQQEQWMQGQLATGNYASDSELLRDLIRKEQVRASQIEVIRQELIKAEQSGYSSRSPEDIVKAVITRKQTNGELQIKFCRRSGLRLTKFYDNHGQIFWPHDKHQKTTRCLFLQTGQGVFKLVYEENIEALFDYSDKNIPATCIRCDVPINEIASFMEPNLGIANFIAARHPHHNQRVEMLCMLADIYFPSKENAAQCQDKSAAKNCST